MIVFTPNTVISSTDVNANFTGLQDGSDINNGAITTAKFKPSYFEYKQATGSNYSTTSTSYVAIGPGTTYTAGSTNETLYVTVSCLMLNTTNYLQVALYADGAEQDGGFYISSQNWVTQSRSWFIDVDAGQTVSLDLYWKVGGGTGQMSRSDTVYTPHIKGWSFYRA